MGFGYFPHVRLVHQKPHFVALDDSICLVRASSPYGLTAHILTTEADRCRCARSERSAR